MLLKNGQVATMATTVIISMSIGRTKNHKL